MADLVRDQGGAEGHGVRGHEGVEFADGSAASEEQAADAPEPQGSVG